MSQGSSTSPAATKYPEIAEIVRRVHRLSVVLGRIAESTLQAELGYGMSQFKILWMLEYHQAGVQQSNIANWLNQTEAAISRQMQSMSEQGLITNAVDPKSRRRHNVRLTAKGKKLVGDGIKCLTKKYQPFFKDLNTTERAQLNQMLESVFNCAVQVDITN